MHILGIAGMSIAVYVFSLAFEVGNPTIQLILVGCVMIWCVYGVTVYDCFKVISKSKKFVKA